jgi:hypothetical protein
MDRQSQAETDQPSEEAGAVVAKFVMLYRGPKGMGDTPDAQQELAQAWGAWYQLLGPGIVDGGHPFGVSSTIVSGGAIAAGAVSGLTGYVVVEAADVDAANQLALGCPALASSFGRVEVYEALAY